jgi:hypothetical protein
MARHEEALSRLCSYCQHGRKLFSDLNAVGRRTDNLTVRALWEIGFAVR